MKAQAIRKLTDLLYQESPLKTHEALMDLDAKLLAEDIDELSFKSKFFAEVEQWAMSYGIECTFQGEALFLYRKGREYQYDLVEGINLMIDSIESEIASQAQ